MVAPLKAGLAGVGTVGSAVVRLIAQQRDLIEARCGRGIDVVAVTARTPDKKRDLGEARPRWVSDPVTLAADAGIDVFVELIGGAIPIVKTLREGVSGNSFVRVYGILNGTCNYILTRMEQEKLSFAECLKDAQRLGYAEADPTFDVEGFDTAQKLALIASLAFGIRVNPDAVYVEGISSITPEDLDPADGLG